MFNRLFDLYVNKRAITIEGLERAVTLGWITEEQKEIIIESRVDENE